MRVVIPYYAAPDSFADNVAHTLRSMGHDVHTMPPRSNHVVDSPVLRIASELLDKAAPNRLGPHERWLLQAVREHRPDLILCLTQSISEDVLQDTRRMGVPLRIAWWGDTPANMRRHGLLTKEWDGIFLKDSHGVAKFRRIGLDAKLLHEAMNPAWHRPVAGRQNDEIVIAGSFYGYRQAITLSLIKAGVPVGLYGGRLPRWTKPEIRKRHTGRFIVREEKSQVFGAGLACLNSTDLSEGNSLNCRAFEIAGAGGLQLLERREIVTQCFEPNREVLVFDSLEELTSLIKRAAQEPLWAQSIREAGARRALAEHTYRHRLDVILKHLH